MPYRLHPSKMLTFLPEKLYPPPAQTSDATNSGPNGMRAHANVRYLVDGVATKISIIPFSDIRRFKKNWLKEGLVTG